MQANTVRNRASNAQAGRCCLRCLVVLFRGARDAPLRGSLSGTLALLLSGRPPGVVPTVRARLANACSSRRSLILLAWGPLHSSSSEVRQSERAFPPAKRTDVEPFPGGSVTIFTHGNEAKLPRSSDRPPAVLVASVNHFQIGTPTSALQVLLEFTPDTTEELDVKLWKREVSVECSHHHSVPESN